MHERWYKQAVIYCLDVETFQDSDGDGVGDFAKLTSRLDYLAQWGGDVRAPRAPAEASAQTGGAAGPNPGPAHGPPFVLRRPSPDTGLLVGLQGVLKARLAYLTGLAHPLGRLGLHQGLARAAEGEEEPGIAT